MVATKRVVNASAHVVGGGLVGVSCWLCMLKVVFFLCNSALGRMVDVRKRKRPYAVAVPHLNLHCGSCPVAGGSHRGPTKHEWSEVALSEEGCPHAWPIQAFLPSQRT